PCARVGAAPGQDQRVDYGRSTAMRLAASTGSTVASEMIVPWSRAERWLFLEMDIELMTDASHLVAGYDDFITSLGGEGLPAPDISAPTQPDLDHVAFGDLAPGNRSDRVRQRRHGLAELQPGSIIENAVIEVPTQPNSMDSVEQLLEARCSRYGNPLFRDE